MSSLRSYWLVDLEDPASDPEGSAKWTWLIRGRLPGASAHLDELQVWARSDRVVGDVDLQEGVELVVAAAEGRRDSVNAIAPVQRVWVVESKRPRRGFVFYKEWMRVRVMLK